MIPTPNMENPGAPAKFYSRSSNEEGTVPSWVGAAPAGGRREARAPLTRRSPAVHPPFTRLVSSANDFEEVLGD